MAIVRLGVRPRPFTLPSYSLTADILSFLRCGLQYRYMRLGGLASSEPVQLWFGQFIHGVLEEAFRRFSARRTKDKNARPEFAASEIDEMIELVEERLAAQGLRAWEEQGRLLGHSRARVAITEVGPSLFPLIHRAEVRLTGARRLPKAVLGGSERYEIAVLLMSLPMSPSKTENSGETESSTRSSPRWADLHLTGSRLLSITREQDGHRPASLERSASQILTVGRCRPMPTSASNRKTACL